MATSETRQDAIARAADRLFSLRACARIAWQFRSFALRYPANLWCVGERSMSRKPRLMYANRCQGGVSDDSLDQLLRRSIVRDVWQSSRRSICPSFCRRFGGAGGAGAPAIDPRIFDGAVVAGRRSTGSVRRGGWRNCARSIGGSVVVRGVEVGYHTLSDFRRIPARRSISS